MYIEYVLAIIGLFFTLHIKVEGDVVLFQYLVSHGEAYDKKDKNKLRLIDD